MLRGPVPSILLSGVRITTRNRAFETAVKTNGAVVRRELTDVSQRSLTRTKDE
jgi:hypothetical protein